MFLFSTPATRETTPANPVVGAIREGAEKTGAGFDYLLKTAQRESGMNPEAKARTSSATGLFQFIEQTWLAMVKQEGGKQGLGDYADAISSDASGRLTVSDAATREKILQMRSDPQVAAVMAGALTQKNGEQLASALGRQPLAGELYMAHVLGARGATDLIRTAATDPTRAAARDFPDAAAANRGIFFDKSGRARSAQEVYGVLSASHATTQAAATSAPASLTGQGADQPVQIASGLSPGNARGLVGLFSTEGSRQPVSAAVANLWLTPRNNATTRLASAEPSERYFPGAVQSDATPPVTISSETVAAATSVTAPLPPSRPADLAVAPVRQARAPRNTPLDLSSFMTQRAGT